LTNVVFDWRFFFVAGAILVLAAAGIVRWLRRHPLDSAEIERRRRSRLNQIGRIAEGHVIDLLEVPPQMQAGSGVLRRRGAAGRPQTDGRKLVSYSYSISGVTYETAQDITGLEERVCLDRVAAGQPASVKYDPANPSNSILVADDWSGLH